VNIPLRDGIDDDSYESIFVPIMSKVMETFQPGAVVLQCGADSLTGDRLGCFNLTVKGHGKCVEFMKKYNLPLLIVGGGGYTIRNVSRCWTYETSVALGVEIANELPYNDYFEYFGPDFKLHISPSNMANQNTPEYLEKIKSVATLIRSKQLTTAFCFFAELVSLRISECCRTHLVFKCKV